LPDKLKVLIVYLNNKQLSIRIPFAMWQHMMRHKIDTGSSMSNLVINLLGAHFKISEHEAIATSLQDHKLDTGQSANYLINLLLEEHFSLAK